MTDDVHATAERCRARLERALVALEASGADCQELRHAITAWVLALGVEARGRRVIPVETPRG
jgi:flagellar biosynthesis regulator FlaF